MGNPTETEVAAALESVVSKTGIGAIHVVEGAAGLAAGIAGEAVAIPAKLTGVTTWLRMGLFVAGLLALMGAVSTAFYFRAQAATNAATAAINQQRLTSAVALNQQQRETIDELTHIRTVDEQSLKTLGDKLDAARAAAIDTQAKIDKLATSGDDETKKYLSTAVPAAVRGVLEHRKPRTRRAPRAHTKPAAKPNAAVPSLPVNINLD